MKKGLLAALIAVNALIVFAQQKTMEDSLKITVRGCTIFGTLALPAGISEKNPQPIALIIAGSGPTDRQGNSAAPINPNSYRMLADSLAERGIASLRFDKRGIGQSKMAGMKEENLRFDDYAADAADWLRLLRADRRFSKMVVVGHSEGSLVGMLAAREAGADGFVSLAGAGRRIGEIIVEQLADQGFNAENQAKTSQMFDTLMAGQLLKQKVSGPLGAIFRPSLQPYLISWLRFDPAAELQKLTCPTLVLQGTTDFQVKKKEAELLAAARPEAKLVFLEGMNHVLKTAPDPKMDKMGNYKTYTDPTLPLAPGLTDALVSFIGGLPK